VLLLEVDSLGITTGAASLQTPGATLASSQGYGFNLTGENANVGEVDDIAESPPVALAIHHGHH